MSFLSRGLDIQLAFLHGILESSGQTKPFVPPCESNILDADDIRRTAQLGDYTMALDNIQNEKGAAEQHIQ